MDMIVGGREFLTTKVSHVVVRRQAQQTASRGVASL